MKSIKGQLNNKVWTKAMSSTSQNKPSGKRAGDKRNRRGSTLVEGVVGIGFVIVMVAVCAIFLSNVVLTISYKQKLGAIANAAVAMVARLRPGAFQSRQTAKEITQQEAELKQYVNDSLRAFGMREAEDFRLDTDKSQFKIIFVSFRVSGLKLLGTGGVLPKALTMSECASIVLPCKHPPGHYLLEQQVNIVGPYGKAAIPSYGRGNPGKPPLTPGFSKALPGSAQFREFKHIPAQAQYSWPGEYAWNHFKVRPGNPPQ